ncbi:MAG: chloride channel protein [Cyanobacteriota bacterium]|nr:chloride channel protein [Cyanobacteriota bacterium]
MSAVRGSSPLVAWLSRLQAPAENILLLLAALVGLGTGLAVVGFRYLIGFFRYVLQDTIILPLTGWGSWTIALLPALGGLLVGILLWYRPLASANLPSLLGVARQERVPITRIPFKLLTAAISLGAGASLGPEAPSVESGGLIGLWLGQQLKFSSERINLLVGAGAAAGLAAGFNAPIAGVFLALELVLASSFTTATVSVVVLAAVISSLTAQVGLGAQPAFMLPAYTQPAFVLPAYEVRSLLELPCYLGLGLLASLVSIAFGYCLNWGKQLFQGQLPGLEVMGGIPSLFKPMVGGLGIGLLGLGLPLGLGVGYETIESLLQAVPFSLGSLALLLLGKVLMTAISSGSGFVGGTFAPALFLGAVVGDTYGQVLNHWLPVSLQVAPPAYAMVGMAAVLAGSVRAPLTAVLLLFEMTRDYQIVLPLMGAVGLSIWVSDRFHSPAVYQSVKSPASHEPMLPALTVGDVMVEARLILPKDMLLLRAAEAMSQKRCYSALVVDEQQRLFGILTLQDIQQALLTDDQQDRHLWTVESVCSTDVLITFPDELMSIAAQRMSLRDLHQLPVVSREDPTQILGLLPKEQIALSEKLLATRQAYQQAYQHPVPTMVKPLPTHQHLLLS